MYNVYSQQAVNRLFNPIGQSLPLFEVYIPFIFNMVADMSVSKSIILLPLIICTICLFLTFFLLGGLVLKW